MNKQKIIDKINGNRLSLEEFSVKPIPVYGPVVKNETLPESDADFASPDAFHPAVKDEIFWEAPHVG